MIKWQWNFDPLPKNYWVFCMCTIYQITYAMCSTSVFTRIMAMICNFMIYFIISVFIFKLFSPNVAEFEFPYDPSYFSVSGIIFYFSKWIIFIACSIKDFMQSIPSKINIQMEYVHLILLQMIFRDVFTSILFNWIFEIRINGSCCFNRFMVLSKPYILVSLEGIATPKQSLIS